MQYLSRTPAPPLDRFIDDLYYLSGEPGHRRRLIVPPMPSAHLMINLGDPVQLRDSDPTALPAVLTDGWFMGVWTRRLTVEYPDAVRVVGVHFKPWGLAPFVRLPMSELRDRWVPADAVWARGLAEFRVRLAEAGSVDAMLRLLEQQLRARLGATSADGLALVGRSGGSLEASWGSVPVGKRYFGSLRDEFRLDDPHLVIQGERVLHLRFKVSSTAAD